MRRKPYPVPQVTGGVDVSQDPLFLADRSSPDLTNIRFDQGLIRKDLGWSAFGTGLPLDASIMAINLFRLGSGTRYNIVTTQDSIYVMTGALAYTKDSATTLTGGDDDLISTIQTIDSTGDEIFVLTNGKDNVKHWTGSSTFADLGGLTSIGTGKVLGAFKNRLLLAHTIESGQTIPFRVRWSVVGNPEDWSGTGSGFTDLIDTPGGIVKLMPLRERYIVIKTDSIWEMVYVGGTKIFDFLPLNTEIGSDAPMACVAIDDTIIILSDSIYVFNGQTLQDIGSPIFNFLYPVETRIVGEDKTRRAAGIYVRQLREYWVSIPTSGNTSRLFKYNFVSKDWTQKDEASRYRYGVYEFSTRESWADWAGQWNTTSGPWMIDSQPSGALTVLRGDDSGYVYQDTRFTTNTDTMVFTTKDWLFGHACRVLEMRIQAKGGPFTVYTSSDKGATWVQRKVLPATTSFYEHIVELNFTVQTLRVKIVTTATTLDIEWIEPWYIERQKSKIF